VNSYELANNFDSYLSVMVNKNTLKECTMKKTVLFLLVITTSICVNAQSLKDLLYGGKLKNDSNSVVRKTDDLNSKIDTSTKKSELQKVKVSEAIGESAGGKTIPQPESVAADAADKDSIAAVATTDNNAATRNNTKIWKDYMDSLASTLKTEVLPSKKLKKDTYYLLVEYEIEPTGQVNVTNVTSTPENDFLRDQVKSRLIVSTPQLNPALDSNNKPRKVKRKYSFNVTKE
jgi:hypothetical protein